MAHTVAADEWWLVDICSLEPPGMPFTVSVKPGVGSSAVRTGGAAHVVTYAVLTGADVGHVYTAFMQALAPFVDHDGG